MLEIFVINFVEFFLVFFLALYTQSIFLIFKGVMTHGYCFSDRKHHHHWPMDKVVWIVPISLLTKLYIIWKAVGALLFGVVVLKIIVFVGSLYVPIIMWSVKKECKKDGFLFG